jgi:DNA polymerase-3 subunit delta'
MGLFNQVIGHQRQKQILAGSYKRRRVSTSYIFSGESGIGKRLVAREFVKLLNCKSPIETDMVDACDSCSNCRKITRMIHPDLLTVEPEKGIIRIDRIREIQEYLTMAPLEGTLKAVVINDAECMNQAAANAFLKTLEEPPPHSLVILITMYPDRLPATVVSRCFHIRFSLLSEKETKEVINRMLSPEQKRNTVETARLAMGRPGIIIEMEDSLREDLKRIVSRLEEVELLDRWSDRQQMLRWLNLFSVFLRDLLVFTVSEDRRLLVNPEIKSLLRSLKKRPRIEDIIDLYNKVCMLRDMSVFNLNTSIVQNFVNTHLRVMLR